MRHILRLPILMLALWAGMAVCLLFGLDWGLAQLLSKAHLLGTLASATVIWLAGLLVLVEHPSNDRYFGSRWTIVMFVIGIIGGEVAYHGIFLTLRTTQTSYSLLDMAVIFLGPIVMAAWITVVGAIDLTQVIRKPPPQFTSTAGR